MRQNGFDRKTMLRVWWNRQGILYYHLLKLGEAVNFQEYKQHLLSLSHAILRKVSQLLSRDKRVILLHDSASCHRISTVQGVIHSLKWDLLPYPSFLQIWRHHIFIVRVNGRLSLMKDFQDVEKKGRLSSL